MIAFLRSLATEIGLVRAPPDVNAKKDGQKTDQRYRTPQKPGGFGKRHAGSASSSGSTGAKVSKH